MQTPCGKRQHIILEESKKADEAGEQNARAGEIGRDN